MIMQWNIKDKHLLYEQLKTVARRRAANPAEYELLIKFICEILEY